MAIVSIIGPNGQATSSFKLVLVGGVTWTPTFKKGCDLIGGNLTVFNLTGPGQGVCVYPEVAQSSGLVYWECTWTGLTNPTLQGGNGLGTIDAIADYETLAANGTGGTIFRPDGSIWTNGVQVGPFSQLTQSESDVVGILADLRADIVAVKYFIVKGANVGQEIQDIFLAPGSYIPCVVFGNDPLAEAVTGNFGADVNSLLGPDLFPGQFEGVFLGWPNT